MCVLRCPSIGLQSSKTRVIRLCDARYKLYDRRNAGRHSLSTLLRNSQFVTDAHRRTQCQMRAVATDVVTQSGLVAHLLAVTVSPAKTAEPIEIIPLMGLLQLRFEHDSSTIRARYNILRGVMCFRAIMNMSILLRCCRML